VFLPFRPIDIIINIIPATSQYSESYLIFLLGRTPDPPVREATARFGRHRCQVRQRARQRLRILLFCLAHHLCSVLFRSACHTYNDTLLSTPLTCRHAVKPAVAIATAAVNPENQGYPRTHLACRCQARHPTARFRHRAATTEGARIAPPNYHRPQTTGTELLKPQHDPDALYRRARINSTPHPETAPHRRLLPTSFTLPLG